MKINPFKIETELFYLIMMLILALLLIFSLINPPKDECVCVEDSCYEDKFALNLTIVFLKECIIDLGWCEDNMTREEVIDYMGFEDD